MTLTLADQPFAKPARTEDGADVYQVHGSYTTTEFRVPAGTEVRIGTARNRHARGDVRATFPSIEVRDSALVIPIVDVIDEIIARANPEELAEALWQDETVRERFIYCLSTRYNSSGIGDADRRKFLTAVQEATHSEAVDKLVSIIAPAEFDHARKFSFYEAREQINRVLQEQNIEIRRPVQNDDGSWTTTFVPLRFDNREPQINGAEWNEAREFWRSEVLKRFPAPVNEVDAAKADTMGGA